ncbi:hypothetical protein E4U41_007165 [Claviceps citrina]|nr:hypothetical protein E4U41_007165 [Claviceps citrina]
MPVQQHVLNWLYSVLTSEYHDVNRTYSDVAQALTNTPTLAPRTDVHTFPNGASALLLHLTGTIPVDFRGNTYRFPISVWIPHAYPREPPIVYVTPTETMVVRPGQHVDPQGLVYHPYLVGWAQFWDKSNLQDFMSVLSDIFSKEPPVVSRAAATQLPRQPRDQAPPSLPPLPPQMVPRQSQTSQSLVSDSQPRPPPPPKDSVSSSETARTSAVSRYDSAPPLPPQVQALMPTGRHSQPLPSAQVHDHARQQPYDARHQVPIQQQQQPQPQPPYSPQACPPHPMQWQLQQRPSLPDYAASEAGLAPAHQQHPTRGPAPAPAPAAAPPPPNILDEPLTLSVPAHTAVAPPPIPPNPEKDNLLRQLGHALFVIRQRTREQNESSMAGLQAQRNAMEHAMAGIHSESSQLTQLSNMLTSNTNILHEALRKADGLIEGSTSHPTPDIDELLVAPTVVSNQLYHLVAEERALSDVIFVLGRAVERGRISPAVFAKTTRSLAREWYLKKALVRKIGQGMGMVV